MDPRFSLSVDQPFNLQPFPVPSVAAATATHNNHIAQAANPTPPVSGTFDHPPYADMICSAIAALNERDGSSRMAIARYIERVYPNLPPAHSALLTHHLKRLKNNGHVVLVKKSYKLPTSTAAPEFRSDLSNNNQPQQALPSTPLSGTKRGRGRPPKPKPDGQPNAQPIAQPFTQPIAQPFAQPIAQPFTQPIVQPIVQTIAQPTAQPIGQSVFQPNGQPNLEPNFQHMLSTLGVSEEPKLHKGRGRPPKNGPIEVGWPILPVVGKKGRGRPPKSMSVAKKLPIRRPKKLPLPVVGPGGTRRGRGRPKALHMGVPFMNAAAAPNAPKRRGRPKKIAAAVTAIRAGGLVEGKRRGRPPKLGAISKPMKPYRSTGRPRGRPRKFSTWEATPTSEPQAVAAYAELKRKVDFFQSKVKEAVDVIKPQLPSDNNSAVAAILELEGLAAMDMTAPIEVDAQPAPVPVPEPASLPAAETQPSLELEHQQLF